MPCSCISQKVRVPNTGYAKNRGSGTGWGCRLFWRKVRCPYWRLVRVLVAGAVNKLRYRFRHLFRGAGAGYFEKKVHVCRVPLPILLEGAGSAFGLKSAPRLSWNESMVWSLTWTPSIFKRIGIDCVEGINTFPKILCRAPCIGFENSSIKVLCNLCNIPSWTCASVG